ncbi:MAG: Ig-like domain-containing protein [Lachnospiraceae bacterium]
MVPVQDIRLTPLSLTLEQGASERLSVQVVPENATDPSVQWSSDNETVATDSYTDTMTLARMQMTMGKNGLTPISGSMRSAVTKVITLYNVDAGALLRK